MNQINNEYIYKIGNLFVNSIKERLIRTGKYVLLCFLCTFTFDGRELIREKSTSLKLNEYDDTFCSQHKQYLEFSNEESAHLNKFISEDFPNIMAEKENYENNQKTLYLIDLFYEDNLDYSEFDDDDESEDIVIKNTMSAMKCFSDSSDENSDTDSSVSIEKYQDIFAEYSPIEYSLDFFCRFAKSNEFPEQSLMIINETYMQWLIQPFSKIVQWTNKIPNPQDIWNVLSLKKEWKELSSIALRNLSIPSSEASAERMFSKQRFAISKYRYRTKKKLEESRMVYSSMWNNLIYTK